MRIKRLTAFGLAISTLVGLNFMPPVPAQSAQKFYTITYKCRKPGQYGLTDGVCSKKLNRQQYDAYLYKKHKPTKRICYNRKSLSYNVYPISQDCRYREGDRLVSPNLFNETPKYIEEQVTALVPRFLEIRRTRGEADNEIENSMTKELHAAGQPMILSVGLAKEVRRRIQYGHFDKSLERPGDNNKVKARVDALNAAEAARQAAQGNSSSGGYYWQKTSSGSYICRVRNSGKFQPHKKCYDAKAVKP